MFLEPDKIREACKGPVKMVKVPTPGWGADGEDDPHVFVRTMPASMASAVSKMCVGKDNSVLTHEDMYVNFTILCCCREDGSAMFDEADRDALMAGPLQPVQECGIEALKLNGVGPNAAAKN